MKVSELIARLSEMKQDADVMFDTEAQTYDVHLVPVDAAWQVGLEEGLDRDIVYFREKGPHRSDDRDARIAALEGTINVIKKLCGEKIFCYKGTNAGDAGTALAREVLQLLTARRGE